MATRITLGRGYDEITEKTLIENPGLAEYIEMFIKLRDDEYNDFILTKVQEEVAIEEPTEGTEGSI